MFVKKFTVFILSISLLGAGVSPTIKIDTEVTRKFLAEKYVQNFTTEFNKFQKAQDLKDLYGYFLPKAQRSAVFKNFKELPVAHAKGSTITFELDKHAVMTFEVVDVLKQEFKINGNRYIHDWNGNLSLQMELIHGLLRKPKSPNVGLLENIWNWLLPQSQAFVFLIPIAEGVAACVSSGVCEAIGAFVAQRAALFVAADSGEIIALAGAAVRPAVGAATRAARAVGTYIMESIEKDPKLLEELRALKPHGSGVEIRGPIKAMLWLKKMSPALAFAAVVVNPILESAKKNGVSQTTAIACKITSGSVDDCKLTVPTILVGPAAKERPEWCPGDFTNEMSTYVKTPDGTEIAKVIGTAKPHGNPPKAEALSAMRFEITPDGRVNASSIRYYTIEDGEVTGAMAPGFQVDSFDGSMLRTKKDLSIPISTEVEQNMLAQITIRQRVLEGNKDRSKDRNVFPPNVVVKDFLKNYDPDPIKASTDNEKKRLDAEVQAANEVMESFRKLSKPCNDQVELGQEAKAPPSTLEPPPAHN